MQSHCAKNGSDRFSCNDQSYCNETCEVSDCKVIETRPQVSLFLLSACFFYGVESFQQTIIVIEEVF